MELTAQDITPVQLAFGDFLAPDVSYECEITDLRISARKRTRRQKQVKDLCALLTVIQGEFSGRTIMFESELDTQLAGQFVYAIRVSEGSFSPDEFTGRHVVVDCARNGTVMMYDRILGFRGTSSAKE